MNNDINNQGFEGNNFNAMNENLNSNFNANINPNFNPEMSSNNNFNNQNTPTYNSSYTNIKNFANADENNNININETLNSNMNSNMNVNLQNYNYENKMPEVREEKYEDLTISNSNNELNNSKKKTKERKPSKFNQFFIEFETYIEVFTVLLVICIVILCFFPICNGSYIDYGALITPTIDNENDIVMETKKEESKVENKIPDSLELRRQVTDTMNDFVYALKYGNFEEAYSKLDVPSYTSKENSFVDTVEYNKGYTFFKTYLGSYDLKVNEIVFLNNGATVRLTINRYDINRVVSRMLAEKSKEGIDMAEESYESLLFEYETYLKDEFSKENAYRKDFEYLIGLNKVDDKWLIINNDELTNAFINLEFKLEKNVSMPNVNTNDTNNAE